MVSCADTLQKIEFKFVVFGLPQQVLQSHVLYIIVKINYKSIIQLLCITHFGFIGLLL